MNLGLPVNLFFLNRELLREHRDTNITEFRATID